MAKESKKKALNKRREKPTNSEAAKKEVAIPQKQWEMPVSFSADGTKMATLHEHVDPNVPTLSLAEMTTNQRAEIVAKRIEEQPKFEISMVGVGTIDKQRAIAEVKAQSKIGRTLIEIEQRLINDLIKRAAQKEDT